MMICLQSISLGINIRRRLFLVDHGSAHSLKEERGFLFHELNRAFIQLVISMEDLSRAGGVCLLRSILIVVYPFAYSVSKVQEAQPLKEDQQSSFISNRSLRPSLFIHMGCHRFADRCPTRSGTIVRRENRSTE